MRKIIHIDMDAFYASVELRERPELQQLPVVIASHHPRAVVVAASYPARQFGLHSAMPMVTARKRCPHVIVIPPDFAKYRAVSAQIHHIFQQYTPLIEPVSLDEAYLDVTENQRGLASATAVAQAIRADILQHTGLTASAGVAPNKFLAKIASDWHKPDGLCVIKPHQVQAFIQDLPLKKIPGVGKVMQKKLAALQLQTLGDLQKIEEAILIQQFGKYGQRLFLYAQGIDDRPVNAERIRQQISKEITFSSDLTLAQCSTAWQPLAEQVWNSLQKRQLTARGLQLKLKDPQFQIRQHSKTYPQPFRTVQELQQAIPQLLNEMQIAASQKFRLVGIGVNQLDSIAAIQQLDLGF